MLGFGFQAWLLGLKPMGFGFRPPPVKPMGGANGVLGRRCVVSRPVPFLGPADTVE
jgi:hypothetical protein